MRAGAGKAEIPIPGELFPLEKFGTIQDPLHVRALLLQAAKGFALISVDMTSLREYAVEEFRRIVSEITALPEEQIWICVTHTFSAPHLRSTQTLEKVGNESLRQKNDALFQAVKKAVRSAVIGAQQSLQDAALAFAQGTCQVNQCRDVKTVEGWWLGQNEQGYSDHTLEVVRVDSLETGKALAILYNYDVQSSVLDDARLPNGICPVSADLAGVASYYLEREYGAGTVALFLMGAAGDQAPRHQVKYNRVMPDGTLLLGDLGAGSFPLCEKLGTELARCVYAVSQNAQDAVTNPEIDFLAVDCLCPAQKRLEPKPSEPKKQYDFESEAPRNCSAQMVLLGNVALVGVKPELSSATGTVLRTCSPFALTMVGTMVNGGEKYMPECSAYERITYEAMNSAYAKGSAELLQDTILSCLKARKEGTT